jgi:hypothetical protein
LRRIGRGACAEATSRSTKSLGFLSPFMPTAQ